ncbi:MAG: glycosyltransferase family 2 protein [Bacteroidales bacterium]|nr:glycosyltransferase family 2 protein [Bacteroidales bacterium]
MDLSVVIPLFNESESLIELTRWIDRVTRDNGLSHEIILVDDGSSDGSWGIITRLADTNSVIRGIRFRRNYGKAAALHCGFQKASGEVVITMDADLQDSPDEIPELYRMITEEGYDLVSGWKKKRKDPITKRWPSRFFNRVARFASGIKLHDFNCGLKAYRKEVVKGIELYGDMHRYVPIIAKRSGFTRIGEKVVTHSHRQFGRSKYGWERVLNGTLDLLTISFITKFSKRPMHFFGSFGLLMMLLGALVTGWLAGVKIHALHLHLTVREVTAQPLFYIALLTVIIGVQFFLTGFLAELVSRSSTDRNKYLIEKEV